MIAHRSLDPEHPAFNYGVLSAIDDDELPVLSLCNIIHMIRISNPSKPLTQESLWKQWYEWICEPKKMRTFYCG